ncbi:hypothetical protein [Nocardia vulneris]|uniref:Uncharacterized protein n=1 Tax=Nocardia vulneris TaxID=1141657 RepID=A0ABR4Z6C6_9NOCA|nr:hypothetical protein [Nocardia vulneris]KIA60837.1 hypothetical protein FG87_34710 [Nocardia vulneris]
MSLDWTNVSVAAITAAGTLSGGIATQLYALRAKRIDNQLQRELRAEELRELAVKEASDEKRAAYAALNTSAHYFRTAARRYLAERAGTAPEPEKFHNAWEALRDSYARSQMVLSDDALVIASEVSRCMDAGRQAVIDADTAAPARIAELEQYLNETLGFAVRLLRRALREDLGIRAAYDVNLDERCQALKEKRHQLFGLSSPQEVDELPSHP